MLLELGWSLALLAIVSFALPALLPIVVLIFLSAAAFTLFFFREPRFVPLAPESGLILSPSYGTVLKTGLENGRPVIRIFLSVLDVHSQYSPVAGTVRRIVVFGEKFFPAFRKEASLNRRNLIEISLAGSESLVVEQIAGSIARRISCPLKAGDSLRPGYRLGLIYFGSQVAVYLPAGAEILVQPGTRVYPCRTILAKLSLNGGR